MQTGKIFMTGRSQAVRLLREFRFSSKEVSIIPLGKGVVLQPLLKTWQNVFDEIKPTDDFFIEDSKDLELQERKWELYK